MLQHNNSIFMKTWFAAVILEKVVELLEWEVQQVHINKIIRCPYSVLSGIEGG